MQPALVRPEDPATSTPVRRPGSIRRTSNFDLLRPGGLADPLLRVRAAARQLRTGPQDGPDDVDAATLDAEVQCAPSRTLLALDTSPELPRRAELLGHGAASGFRARAFTLLPKHETGSLLGGLLDDLPVAVLIAGYAEALHREQPPARASYRPKVDLCSGWSAQGTMMLAISAGRPIPLTVGPAAPELADGDASGWHDLDALPPLAMRRVRRLDVTPGQVVELDAMFRDTYVDADGVQSVLHEYELRVVLDADDLTIREISATPRVLPWGDCPRAAVSVASLVGAATTNVALRVRTEFMGTTTCTHLNDLLRSLGSVAAMLRG